MCTVDTATGIKSCFELLSDAACKLTWACTDCVVW